MLQYLNDEISTLNYSDTSLLEIYVLFNEKNKKRLSELLASFVSEIPEKDILLQLCYKDDSRVVLDNILQKELIYRWNAMDV